MSDLKLHVKKLDAATAPRFEASCLAVEGVKEVDTWPNQAHLKLGEGANPAHILATLRNAGFEVDPANCATAEFAIDGMHCRSCEITVEKKFKSLPGVERVNVDVAKGRAVIEYVGKAPSLSQLENSIKEDGYSVRTPSPSHGSSMTRARPMDAITALIVVSLAVWLGSKTGLFDGFGATAAATGFGAAVLLGLVAGSSSCLAVSGGLMLTMAANYRSAASKSSMKPVFMFLTGRVASYAGLGALIGIIGAALTPAPIITAGITLLAAGVMLVMGLDMLGVAPAWLKHLMPRMPKSLAHKITDAAHGAATPFLLGALTFFIPCGFTQALQIYALTVGGTQAAAVLGGFALGTVPALLVLGYASNSLKGRAGELFLRYSGAFVLLLGLLNMRNGLIAAGVYLPAPRPAASAVANEGQVQLENGVQVITMKLTATAPYYSPSNEFTVKKGVPVKLVLNGIGMGCRSQFQIPKFGISVPLNKSQTVIEFTPDTSGRAVFSCSMGMYPGTITVI